MTGPRSNAEFLANIYGLPEDGSHGWAAGFPGDPKLGQWTGWPATFANCDGPGLNWYFTLATYRHGTNGRTDANCAAVLGVMLDDVGTKALPLADVCARLAPSVIIETSPGNYQALYLFAQPETDRARVAALHEAICNAGLCDRNAKSPPTRYCRMPFAINGKPQHGGFNCRLVEWHPQRRYTIEAIEQGLRLQAVAPKPPRAALPAPEFDLLTPEAQQQLVSDIRSALACLPVDDRDAYVSSGQQLKSLGEVGRELWTDHIKKSHKYEAGDEDRFDGFDGTRSDYRAIFNKAAAVGWVNPKRARDAAATFGTGPALQPLPGYVGPKLWPTITPETPLNTARKLIHCEFSHEGAPTLKFWRGEFYRWSGSHWRKADDTDISARVYAFTERDCPVFHPNTTKVNHVIHALKGVALLDSTTEAPAWIEGTGPEPVGIVACSNGLLDLDARTLAPATPRFFNVNAVPPAYLPQAPAPAAWLQFLAQVFENDTQGIGLLQELFGYLLTADTSQQKIFLVVGPKRSGKGTIGRVLTEMLGASNVVGPTLSGMGKEFGLQPLIGKLVAIVSDARLGGSRDEQQGVAENLLRISGEDLISVNRKNLAAVTTHLGVRFLLFTNELPRIADTSGAMASRFLILQTKRSFFGKEDPGLTGKLLAELPGVFAWALEGRRRLRERGYFQEPESSAVLAQEMADLGSPIGAFMRDECVAGPGREVPMSALYLAWCTWCAQQGTAHPGDRTKFGRDLRAVDASIGDKRANDGEKRERKYTGIALKTKGHMQGEQAVKDALKAISAFGVTPA